MLVTLTRIVLYAPDTRAAEMAQNASLSARAFQENRDEAGLPFDSAKSAIWVKGDRFVRNGNWVAGAVCLPPVPAGRVCSGQVVAHAAVWAFTSTAELVVVSGAFVEAFWTDDAVG